MSNDTDASDAGRRDATSDVRVDSPRADVAADAPRADVATDTGTDVRTADVRIDTNATPDAPAEARADAAPDVAVVTPDTGVDAGRDAVADAGIDVRVDAPIPPVDAGTDVRADTGVDAAPDVVVVPPVDAGSDAAPDARADAGAEAAVDAGTDGGATLQYGFENGLDNWTTDTFDGAAPITLTTSTAQHDTGAASMVATITGTTEYNLTVFDPPAGIEQGRFSFRVFVPVTSSLTFIKAFDCNNDDQCEEFTLDASQAAEGAWHTFDVVLPTVYQAVDGGPALPRGQIGQLGLQIEGSGPIYFDTFMW